MVHFFDKSGKMKFGVNRLFLGDLANVSGIGKFDRNDDNVLDMLYNYSKSPSFYQATSDVMRRSYDLKGNPIANNNSLPPVESYFI